MEVNPEILEIFCKISQKIAIVKGIVAANCLNGKQDKTYIEIRNLLDDCVELMAIKADVAPIRLITAELKDEHLT